LTKCSFGTVELDDEWKLFHSGVEPSKFVQAGVGILVRLHLASCVDEWIPLGDKVHALESCVGGLIRAGCGTRICRAGVETCRDMRTRWAWVELGAGAG